MLAGVKCYRQQFLRLFVLFAITALPLSFFHQSIWRDEASSVWFARLPLSTLLTALCDPHPPGYYLFLKAWLLGGEEEFWLRLPSWAAAILAVALTYRWGRDICGRRCAWLAALLLALHPLQSWYAAEIRAYMLVQAFGLLLVWLGWQLLQTSHQRRTWWGLAGLYGVGVVVAFGIDYTILLPLSLLQLLWLAQYRSQPWTWLGLQAATILLAMGLWLNRTQLVALRHGYHGIFMAVQANRLGFDLTPLEAVRLMQVVVIGLGVVGIVGAWYWPTYLTRPASHSLISFLVIGGWLALLLLSALARAFTLKRQLVVLLPYLALVSAYGLARLPRPIGELIASVGLLITLLILPGHQREPWRTVVAEIVRQETDRASVIWVDELSVPAFDYYIRRHEEKSDHIRWTPFFDHNLSQLPDLMPQPGQTLFIITAESDYRRLSALLPLEFHRHYRWLETRSNREISLYRYQRRTRPALKQPQTAGSNRPERWGLRLPSPLDTCK